MKPTLDPALSTRSGQPVDAERVTQTRRKIVSHQEAIAMSSFFRLLSDPTRARMLYALLEAGELCVADLAATVGAPETSVSHALGPMKAKGVVKNQRKGRMIYYSLADTRVRMILEVALAFRKSVTKQDRTRTQTVRR